MLKSKSVELKLVIVGNDCVGKTSIASYIKSKVFSENYTSTIGAGFYDSTFCIDGINIDLYIWDTAGKEIYHPLLPMYARYADGIIIVFDVTNDLSFNNLQTWIEKVKKIEENSIIIIIGNKADLINERKISKEQAEAFSIERDLHYFETSIKNKEGIDEFLTYLVTKIFYSKHFQNKHAE